MNSGTQTLNASATGTAWPSGALRAGLGRLFSPWRSNALKLSIEAVPIPCLSLEGELTRHTAPGVKQAVREVIARPAGRWQINLGGITRWDAEGLATLVYALDLSELNGRELQLVAPPAPLRGIIERAQLHRLFWIVDESQDA